MSELIKTSYYRLIVLKISAILTESSHDPVHSLFISVHTKVGREVCGLKVKLLF